MVHERDAIRARREAALELAEDRRPPRAPTRTAVATGGGRRVWVCFARMKIFYARNPRCKVGSTADQHTECGYFQLEHVD